MARYMGIDVGTVRIGVALSDVNASIASPHTTVEAKRTGEAAREIAGMVDDNDVEAIVIGWPLEMDGTEGRATDFVRRFTEALGARLDQRGLSVPIERWDERMTSMGAESVLLEADLTRQKRRDVIDRVAASKILQSYLNSLD